MSQRDKRYLQEAQADSDIFLTGCGAGYLIPSQYLTSIMYAWNRFILVGERCARAGFDMRAWLDEPFHCKARPHPAATTLTPV